jgi:cytochrome c553
METRLAAAAALAAAALLCALAPPAVARERGDAVAGRSKAGACVVCHGPLGLSVVPEVPHLAGQPEGYLVAQLEAFRSGARRSEQMSVVAKQLSDRDVADLAAWFSSIPIRSESPPGRK